MACHGTINPDHKVRKLSNGLIAVEQGKAFGFPMSFNPDDDMFYVHDDCEDPEVLAIRASKHNAVQAARLLRLKRDQQK